jgi:hypothetical protein
MVVTILGNPYEVQVQYHQLNNITYVLLDAPVFRKQTKTEPYPPRMDDLDSAIYYSAWNACIAEAIKRFEPDIYHINVRRPQNLAANIPMLTVSRTTMEVLRLYTSSQKPSPAACRKSRSISHSLKTPANSAVDSTMLNSKDCGLCEQTKSQTKYHVFTI